MGSEKAGIAWSVCAVGSALLLLILTVAVYNDVLEVYSLIENIEIEELKQDVVKGNFAAPIFAFIFSTVLLVLSIIRNKLAQKRVYEW